MVPSTQGQLVWDAMCPDALASSYHFLATSTGKVASAAEEKKAYKYAMLGQLFCP